jgi:hypothetical protein
MLERHDENGMIEEANQSLHCMFTQAGKAALISI